jgi:hypothetical protein
MPETEYELLKIHTMQILAYARVCIVCFWERAN